MKILCERNKLKMTLAFENSVASYTNKTSNGNLKLDCKNNNLNLRNISKGGSNKTIWFRYDNCLHDFKLSPYNLITRNQWCSYCCVFSRKLCDYVNFVIKSYLYHIQTRQLMIILNVIAGIYKK